MANSPHFLGKTVLILIEGQQRMKKGTHTAPLGLFMVKPLKAPAAKPDLPRSMPSSQQPGLCK